MKGEFFRPCPKCGKICNANLDMCEICSGKITKPEQPKSVAPIVPVVEPVFEPVMEDVVPVPVEETTIEEVAEEVVTEETAVEEIATEAIIEETVAEEVIEENITEENKEEKYAPITENAETPKAVKNNNRKGLYALIAVLMLVIVALVVIIVQDRQPTVSVGNTTLPSNTTSTTLVQETETTTEITTGTTTENAGETLAPVTTTKKAQNTNKETTTKKNQVDVLDEDITSETNKVKFNPTIVYSKNKVYRQYDKGYAYDYKINNVYISTEEVMVQWDGTAAQMIVEVEILAVYECAVDANGDYTQEIIKEVTMPEKLSIKDSMLFYAYAYYYTKNNEKYDWTGFLYRASRDDFRAGLKLKDKCDFSEEDMKLLKQIVLYRKLGLSINEIKSILNNTKELASVLHQRALELEREKVKQELLKRIVSGESIENIEREINHIGADTIIIKKIT